MTWWSLNIDSRRRSNQNTNLHFASISLCSRWLVGDLWPSRSTLLPEMNMLCTDASEYNPHVSKRKTSVYLSFIIDIQQTLCLYMYTYQNIKVFIRNCINLKMAYVRNHLQKDERAQRPLAGDWQISSVALKGYKFNHDCSLFSWTLVELVGIISLVIWGLNPYIQLIMFSRGWCCCISHFCPFSR